MKKKLTVILLLFIIIIIAAVNFYRKNDFRTLKKPDKIELDIPMNLNQATQNTMKFTVW